MAWYVINTHPKKEFLASAQCNNQGFETFLPTYLCSYPRIGERLKPLFPSYLFVQFDADNDRWYPLCHSLGVKRLFATNPSMNKKKQFDGYIRPTAVSDAFINSLREQAVQQAPSKSPVICPGARLKVTGGYFDGKEGICSWSSEKRVALLLEVMNGKMEFSFSRDSVELIDA